MESIGSSLLLSIGLMAGLAFILALLIFTTVNDLGSFGLWERLGRLIG